VQFIDRPASRPVGIYGVDVERGGPPTLLTQWIVSRSGDGAFYVYPDQDKTIVEQVTNREKYVIANGGRPVSVSPDGQRLLWQVTDQRGDFDRRRGQIWVANVDGTDARIVAETVGLGQSQWIDKERILLVGGPLENLPYVSVAALTLGTAENGDQRIELAQAVRPRGALVSPEGNWLVYYLTFQPDAADDGLWLVSTDASQPPRKLDFFGSYRWRDEAHLLYVPLEPGVESHTLWEYDLVSAESRRLTDPARVSFKIANNDWDVSPDGRHVVFVNAADHNLWLIELSPTDS
jgi:Tol biopolymer transport system component